MQETSKHTQQLQKRKCMGVRMELINYIVFASRVILFINFL